MTLNETSLEKRFQEVSTSAGSIQSLSFFCLHYKNHHKKIAQIWLKCLQKSKVSHRLTLIYLANDIVQNAKRKNALSFINDFKTILKETIPYLRDEKIKKTVERVFSIWQDRSIFDSKFTIELKNSLNETGGKPPHVKFSKSVNSNESQGVEHYSNDFIENLDRLAEIEKNVVKLRSSDNNIVDRLAQGNLDCSDDVGQGKVMDDLKNYIIQLKTEIEERNKLARLLEDSMNNQKRLLKESEEQLVMYKSQLEYITKLRDDLRSPN